MNDFQLPIPETSTQHVSDMREDLIRRFQADPKEYQGYPTVRWPAFNDGIGGFTPRSLTTITADTGKGKTSFAINWLMDAVSQGYGGLFVSLEESWEDMAEILAVMVGEKPLKSMEDAEVGGVISAFDSMPLWYVNKHGRIPQKLLFEAMRKAVELKDVKFVLIDNMDYIIRDRSRDSESSSIGDFMCDLAGLSKALNVATVMIVHPSKLGQKDPKKIREIDPDEMKGSSAIKQESSNVFSLFRPNPQTTEMALRFAKIRSRHHSKNTGSIVRFSFNPSTLWFKEISHYPEWGKYDEDGMFEQK